MHIPESMRWLSGRFLDRIWVVVTYMIVAYMFLIVCGGRSTPVGAFLYVRATDHARHAP